MNVDEEDEEQQELTVPWFLYVVAGVVGTGVVASTPFLVILALKSRRARRRRTRGAATDQLAGAWDEVVDRARDLGYVAPTSRTRREAASNLQASYPGVPISPMAQGVDAAIFGAAVPDGQHSEAAWGEVRQLRRGLLAAVPWYARPAAVFSTRSLKRRRTEAAHDKRRKTRRARAGAAVKQAKES